MARPGLFTVPVWADHGNFRRRLLRGLVRRGPSGKGPEHPLAVVEGADEQDSSRRDRPKHTWLLSSSVEEPGRGKVDGDPRCRGHQQ